MTIEKRIKKEMKKESIFQKTLKRSLRKLSDILNFPFSLFGKISSEYNKKLEKKNIFSSERAKKFFDKYLLYLGDLDKENGSIFVAIDTNFDLFNCSHLPKFATKKEKRFFNHYKYFELISYLEDDYQIEGYEKIVKKNCSLSDYGKYFSILRYWETATESARRLMRNTDKERAVFFKKK